MPSAKHSSTMQRATGLISSLLDIALSWDVPFCQLQQLYIVCIMVLPLSSSVSCFFLHGFDSHHGIQLAYFVDGLLAFITLHNGRNKVWTEAQWLLRDLVIGARTDWLPIMIMNGLHIQHLQTYMLKIKLAWYSVVLQQYNALISKSECLKYIVNGFKNLQISIRI